MGKEKEIALKKAHQAAKHFRKAMREAHDPERAHQEKRYLKSPYKFYGVSVPFLRKLIKDFARSNRDASQEAVFKLSETLWQGKYHQEKSLAIILIDEYPHYLDKDAVPFIKHFLTECNGWDHADWTSIRLMGQVLMNDMKTKSHLVRWAVARPLWLRRASLTAQIRLLRAGGGDRELFFRLARGMVEEKEFFIRKAIGWVVREISKADPEAARDFLMSIRAEASGLTIREGARRLPATMKEEVLLKP